MAFTSQEIITGINNAVDQVATARGSAVTVSEFSTALARLILAGDVTKREAEIRNIRAARSTAADGFEGQLQAAQNQRNAAEAVLDAFNAGN